MPVTAKLSRKFYDTLGDEATNELVDWLNTVDLSYRQEFRDLFQAHFGALDARFAQLDAGLARVEGFGAHQAERIQQGESGLGDRIQRLELQLGERIQQVESRLGERIQQVEVQLGTRIGRVESQLQQLEERVNAKLEALKSSMLQWTFLLWLGTIGIVLGIEKL